MMNLTAALNAARSSIAAKSFQTAVTAENINNADNPHFSRRLTSTTGLPGSGVNEVSVTRAGNIVLFKHFLDVTSDLTDRQAVADGVAALENTIGDPQTEDSPASLIGKFQNSLQSYATLPGDQVTAENAIQSAVDLATSLNQASSQVQQVRSNADAEIGRSVARINSLLEQFQIANRAIVIGTGTPSELTGYLDTRDAVLASLSEELDIKTVTRSNNDIAIYTKGGAVLYETRPRKVTFQPSGIFTPSTTGNQVYVDGVPVTGNTLTMVLNSGKLKGLVELRDNISVTYQNQLDEMARGLIEAFSEQDQSAVSGLPDVPGLFTYPGAPAMPASGVLSVGLAAKIKVNPNVDPAMGGDVRRLRDGGISDPSNPAYIYNSTGAAGFSDRLLQLYDALSAPRPFAADAGIDDNASLLKFSTSSVSWFEGLRSSTQKDVNYRTSILARSSAALSRATGVDLDAELSVMTDLERSYAASAKLLSTVDSMFSTLLASMR